MNNQRQLITTRTTKDIKKTIIHFAYYKLKTNGKNNKDKKNEIFFLNYLGIFAVFVDRQLNRTCTSSDPVIGEAVNRILIFCKVHNLQT